MEVEAKGTGIWSSIVAGTEEQGIMDVFVFIGLWV